MTYRSAPRCPAPIHHGDGIWTVDPDYRPKIRNFTERALTFNDYPVNAASRCTWHVYHRNAGGPAGAHT